MGCVGKLSVNTLMILNFLLFVSGGLLLGFGIWICCAQTSFVNTITKMEVVNNIMTIPTSHSSLKGLSYFFIVVGIVVLALSIFGLCGSCSDDRCCLSLNAILLVSLLTFEIGAGYYVFNNEEEVGGWFKGSMTKAFQNMHIDKNHSVEYNSLNSFMNLFECCGSNNYTDFNQTQNFGGQGQVVVPEGCCKRDMHNCTTHPTIDNSNMLKGCYSVLRDLSMTRVKEIFIFITVIVSVQFFILSLTLLSICCQPPEFIHQPI